MYVCITGLRSVGKSTLARSLAHNRRLSFYDTDTMADRWLAQNGLSFLAEMQQRRYSRIYDAVLSSLPEALDDPNGSVIAAGWGCFQHPRLARVLADRTFVVAVLPAIDPKRAAEALYPRERLRPHFYYLHDDDLMELCVRDAQDGIALLARHCHVILLTGTSGAEIVYNQTQTLLDCLDDMDRGYANIAVPYPARVWSCPNGAEHDD